MIYSPGADLDCIWSCSENPQPFYLTNIKLEMIIFCARRNRNSCVKFQIDGVYHQPNLKENCLGCPGIPVQSVSYNDARSLMRSVLRHFQCIVCVRCTVIKLTAAHICSLWISFWSRSLIK